MGRAHPTGEDTRQAEPPPPSPQAIYEARLGSGTAGSVLRVPPPIDQAQAVSLRKRGIDVVVCGPDKAANSLTAQAIEQAANGRWKRCRPHVNAGPNSLPQYQPDPRPPAGHTFYETDHLHAL